LDSEFLTLAVFFIIIGGAGVVLFNGPLTSAKDSCYCLIPSPEPAAAQGTASIILLFGVLFIPIGILKGGLPSLGRRQPSGPLPAKPTEPAKSMTPLSMRSGKLYTLGIALIVGGAALLAIPGFLLLNNLLFLGAGAAVIVLGVLAIYFGFKA